MKNHSSFSPVASLVKVIRRPGHNTAFAFRTCFSGGTENLSESKNFGSGQKRTVVPVLRGADVADRLQLRGDLAVLEADVVFLAAALDRGLELLRERVHHRHADAVQAAGELVVLVGEFAARMQAREDQLDAADLLLRMDVHRHAAAIVRHLQRAVLEQRDIDLLAVTRQTPHRHCCR